MQIFQWYCNRCGMKGSFDVTLKLVPCDLEVIGSSYKNSLLLCRVKLYIIDPSPGPHINENFVHQSVLYCNAIDKESTLERVKTIISM